VLSHPHPDHFLGLPAALGRVEVGAFWDTGQGEAEGTGGAYATLLAGLRARRVSVRRPEQLCGAHELSSATVEVLHPCPSFVPLGHANDNPFVVRVGFGQHHALLVGDAELAAETTLLEHNVDVRAEFLKVGHHGSRTSSGAAFLAAVHPRWAAISCGVRNRFGHPHRAAVDRLLAAGIVVHRTDREGTIRFETDGLNALVTTASP
jgi:competence protein ComEC